MATDVMRLLNAVRRDYPTGIPKELRRKPVEPTVAFITDDPLTDETRTLLHGAVTLGMKLPIEAVVFIEGPARSLPESVTIVVELGGGAPGIWRDEGTRRILTSYEPTMILAHRETKRKFWEHLKEILTILDR